MPYKAEKIRLPERFDRRIKIPKALQSHIRQLHKQGIAIRAIGRLFNVDKSTIAFILFPERLQRNRQRQQERGGWRQYYNAKKSTLAVAEHRRYKNQLHKANLI